MALSSVTGNLKNILGQNDVSGTVRFTLTNYGVDNTPMVVGSNIIVPVTTDVVVQSDGSFSVNIQGNDTITPANTLYAVTYYTPGGEVGPALYNIIGSSFSLNTNTPVTPSVSSVPFGAQFANYVFAGPPSGPAAVPTFRPLVPTDLPLSSNLNFSGTNTHSGSETFSNGVITNALTDSGLTSGQCVQAGAGGILTTIGTSCAGAAGGVTNFSFSEVGIDPLFSGVVTNPSTTPNLGLTASLVQPGQFLRGPIPTGSTTNPTFENSAVNNGTGTVVSITSIPAAALSSVIYFAETNNSQTVPNPAGWTDFPVAVPGTLSKPHFKNISSTAPVTASSTLGSSATWAASLEFLGGSITSIPQNATFSNCGTGCISGSLGAVTAGHTIIVFIYWGGSVFMPDDARISDSVGNGYLRASIVTGPSSPAHGHLVFIAQNVAAGTPTITVNTSRNMDFSGGVAYELVGPTAYYAGPNGPWQFGYITAADLIGAGIQTIQTFSSTTISSDVPVLANTSTTVMSRTVTMPQVGCPCRVDARYGIYYTFPSGTLVVNAWVSDGTNVMASSGADQIGNGSGFGLNASQVSPGTYGSGAVVTFTLLTKGNNGYTISAAPLNSGPSNSWFGVAVVTSN